MGPALFDCLFVMQRAVGCIFGELLLKAPLLPGRTELEQVPKLSLPMQHYGASDGIIMLMRSQLTKIVSLIGPPSEIDWPAFPTLSGELYPTQLSNVKNLLF